MKFSFLALLIIVSGNSIASITLDKNSADISKDLKDTVHLDVASPLMLNKYLKEKKIEENSYYEVKFTCKHSSKSNKDKCKVSDLNFRKKK